MDPGLIVIVGFLVAAFALRAGFTARKNYRINPDPEPDAKEETSEPSRPRASYGAARSRTRKKLK
ncbi:hypothetical protein KUV47_07175 [Vannielia litorea]|uniref:hypothetical protein n=1 Tax=Vannielia litorea TaxID=1217970 RepID=UPI001C93AD61|nr:hypothetical protein [Vannielia litorea]MBY6152985.1 hypothetical protein [Vannielia litorea]